jgi:hypothetical protein
MGPRASRRARDVALLLSLCSVLAACAGSGDSVGSSGQPIVAGSFADVQRTVFDQSCTTSACHSDASRAGGLSLASDQAYDQLVNVPPQNSTARSDGLLRVTPSSDGDSFLLRKLSGDLAPGEGSVMPLGTSGLKANDPAAYEMIRQWVLAGAQRDTPEGIEPTPSPSPTAAE